MEVPGEAVEVPDVVPAPGQQSRVVSGIHICDPGLDHAGEGLGPVRRQRCAAPGEVPVDRLLHVSVAQLGQGGSFGRVALADVVIEGGEDLGVTVQQRGDGAAGSDGRELPRVTDQDDLRPRLLDLGDEPEEVGIGGHGGFVDDHDAAVVEGDEVVVEAPEE